MRGLALAALGGALLACDGPSGASVVAPVVWEYPGDVVRPEVTEAPEPPLTPELVAAAVRWLGPIDDVPLSDMYDFARVVADRAPDRRAALTLVSIGAYESRFHADVGSGRMRGDGGAACGYLQIHLDIQKRPGDPSCAEATSPTGLGSYVAAALRWLWSTPTAWGNIGWHRQRVTSWLAGR